MALVGFAMGFCPGYYLDFLESRIVALGWFLGDKDGFLEFGIGFGLLGGVVALVMPQNKFLKQETSGLGHPYLFNKNC